jgi:hypothetical protein
MMNGKQKDSLSGRRAHFWSEERKMTTLLVALILDMTIIYPLVSVIGSNVAIQVINSVVISAILFLGLAALTHRKIGRRILGGVVLSVIIVRFVHLVFNANWLTGWEISLSLATVIVFVYLILRFVYKEGPVTRLRIQGAVAAYLLIAIAFAASYHLIFFLIPEAFTFTNKALYAGNARFEFNFHYFSIVTITTLGYGDIIPVHPFARTLAMMEALIGQLYPAILLARLISLHVVHSQKSTTA